MLLQFKSDEKHRGFGPDQRLIFRHSDIEEQAVNRVIKFDPNVTTGGGTVYQAHTRIPELNGRSFVVGSWVVSGQPAGICFREDVNTITNDDSCFLPHWVSGAAPQPQYRQNADQAALRRALYGETLYGETHTEETKTKTSSGWFWSLFNNIPTTGTANSGEKSNNKACAQRASRPVRPKPPPAPSPSYHAERSGVRASPGGIGRRFGSAAS